MHERIPECSRKTVSLLMARHGVQIERRLLDLKHARNTKPETPSRAGNSQRLDVSILRAQLRHHTTCTKAGGILRNAHGRNPVTSCVLVNIPPSDAALQCERRDVMLASTRMTRDTIGKMAVEFAHCCASAGLQAAVAAEAVGTGVEAAS
jgi:hypothetical protein